MNRQTANSRSDTNAPPHFPKCEPQIITLRRQGVRHGVNDSIGHQHIVVDDEQSVVFGVALPLPVRLHPRSFKRVHFDRQAISVDGEQRVCFGVALPLETCLHMLQRLRVSPGAPGAGECLGLFRIQHRRMCHWSDRTVMTGHGEDACVAAWGMTAGVQSGRVTFANCTSVSTSRTPCSNCW